MVKEAREWLSGVDDFLAVDLTDITAAEATALRKEIRTVGGSLKVVKNTVIRESLVEMGKTGADSLIDRATALAWGEGDAIVLVARILDEWKKKSKRLKLKGGWMQGRTLSSDDVSDLAAIPPREQLYAMVVGALAAPMTRLAWTLNGLLTGLVIVLKKVSERRNGDG